MPDVYRLSKGRFAVAVKVTANDIRQGFNGRVAGVYLLRGAWYGKDLTSPSTYGKTEGLLKGQGDARLVWRGKNLPPFLRKRI